MDAMEIWKRVWPAGIPPVDYDIARELMRALDERSAKESVDVLAALSGAIHVEKRESPRMAPAIKKNGRAPYGSVTSRIREALARGPATTREISEATGLSPQRASVGLVGLRQAGKVARKRVIDSPFRLYRYRLLNGAAHA